MTPAKRPPALVGRWRLALVNAGLPLVALLVAAAALALWAAWKVLEPTPDKKLVLATGPDQGAYEAFARRYLPLLQAQGLTVTLRATQGSGENLALLRDPASGVDAAFVQGGVEPSDAAGRDGAVELASLGSVAVEPLWLFYRADSAARRLPGQTPDNLAQLDGWRIDTGPPGGGSRLLFGELAAANGLPADGLIAGDSAAVHRVVALVQGQVDALALVSAAEAPLVQYLLRTPGVRLFDFAQAEAYSRRFPSLHPLVLPRGVVDLGTDRPPADLRMVGTHAALVVRADLHPALVQLLLQAARSVHDDAGWFSRPGEFPRPGTDALPLAPEAERYYRDGPPWLQRYLPFWVANFFDRMWIVLLPLLAALLPLSRIVPPLVTLRLRSRVYRWYANLRALEREIERPDADFARLGDEIERLDMQTERIGVPLSFTNELYDLRAHIHLVRRRLHARAAGAAAAPP